MDPSDTCLAVDSIHLHGADGHHPNHMTVQKGQSLERNATCYNTPSSSVIKHKVSHRSHSLTHSAAKIR